MNTRKVRSDEEAHQKVCLQDDPKLLEIMLSDARNQPPLYNAGPYWATKAKNAAAEIKRCGIADFRGCTNLIGASYSDNLNIDIRNALSHGLARRLIGGITKTYPLSRIFDGQVQWTKSYADTTIVYAEEILNLSHRTEELLRKYSMPYSLLGNCYAKAKIGSQDISIQYLNLLDQHDYLASHISFGDAQSVFEIGGGFGVNIHLLLGNYESIKKVLYLDIPPNLYVGTQYLKSFYGSAVFDYGSLRRRDPLQFSSDKSLEIFCIAPWQIETFASAIDIFMNSHSFVEMPTNVVQNYADKFGGFPDSANTAIALTSYDCFDLTTTFHPAELPKFFKDRGFDHFERPSLLSSSTNNLFYVSTP
jgi:putative sugar O-methyltransferase